MRNLFFNISELFRLKRGYFFFLIILTLGAIVLGIFAGINFSGGILVIDLSNIAYIEFLKGDSSFVSMIFKLLLSLLIFFLIIHICNIKPALIPLSVLFFMYLVYSQTVVFISVIMIYGFFNCIIFSLLHLVYTLTLFFLFILLCMELSNHCNCTNYFSTTFNINKSSTIFIICGIVILTLIFCLILTILKSFVILLVY